MSLNAKLADCRVAVIGGGPAGLMAADVLATAGVRVTIYDHMPSLGRKLLMAGRGGLNLTHSEPLATFLTRYTPAHSWLEPTIRAFPPTALVEFVNDLGLETFQGSSGRIFPKTMKASPLLRAWLRRLFERGVEYRLQTRWTGFAPQYGMNFTDEHGIINTDLANAFVLALGGASWPRLGSDGAWRETLASSGIAVAPLDSANCGIAIPWSHYVRERFAGVPVKRIALVCNDTRVRGEAVVTVSGLEGHAVYALSRSLRTALRETAELSPVVLEMDLRPDLTIAELSKRIAKPRGKGTMSNWLRKSLALAPIEIALLREAHGRVLPSDVMDLARLIKGVRLPVKGLSPISSAISTAGGIVASEIDETFMLRRKPGVFVAGEMLDWEAPTGGYLLQACFATGRAAGLGALGYLAQQASSNHPIGASLEG